MLSLYLELYIRTEFSIVVQVQEGTTSSHVVCRILYLSNHSCSHVTELMLEIQRHYTASYLKNRSHTHTHTHTRLIVRTTFL